MKKINFNIQTLASAIAFLGIAIFFSACDDVFIGNCDPATDDWVSQNFALAPFSTLRLHADADVYLTQGSEQSVRIEGPTNVVNSVTLGVEGQTWNIDMDRCLRGSYTLKIYLTAPNIQSIEMLSSGHIESLEPIVAERMDLRIEGSGDIRLQIIDATEIFSVINGSGKIALEGDATKHDIHINGSGDLSSYQLYCDEVDANLSASGNAYVFAKDQLEAGISGSGSLFYKGYPDLSASISGSGSVVESN